MSVSIAQQVDLLYKQAFGVTKTDTANNKSPSNESIPSPLLIRGDTLWAQSDQIPAIAAAVSGVVQAYTGASAVQMTADNTTVPVGGIYPTWLTNLTYWIPQEFGSTYSIKIYVDNAGVANPTITGTEIFAAGSGGTGEFYYNYQSGVLNFIGGTIPAALTSGKVLYAVGYRYIGKLGVTDLPSNLTIGNLNFNNTTISTVTTNGNLILSPNGTGQITTTSSFTGSDFYGNSITVSNATINLELTGNTANFNNISVLDFVASNTANLGNIGNITILGGSNGQFLKTDGSGVLSWATVDASKIANGNSNVDIPSANGNVTISAEGNANILVITGTGVNVAGTLHVTGNANVDNLIVVGNIANANNISVTNALNANTGNFSGNLEAGNANLGNSAFANHVHTSQILNGNSNIGLEANGNINVSVTGLANVVTFSSLGTNVVGYVSANGAGVFGQVESNSVTALVGNLQLYSEQSGNSYIELKPFGNGTVDVANFRITSLATPNAATDAATKQYVDDVAQGLNVHDAVYAATTDTLDTLTNGGIITYNNGANGVGATLTLTGSYTIDFTTANCFDSNTIASVSQRILVKDEVANATNGIYVVSSATVLVRAADFNSVPEIEPGDFLFVQDGTTNGGTGWVQTANVITVGTDPIVFSQFSGGGQYTAGSGLTLTGTVFSVNVDNLTTEISGGNVVVKANAQLTTPNIDAATGTSLDLTGNVIAGNLNANTKITSLDIDASGNIISNNLTVNSEFSGNTANFVGNVILPNLTVNVELDGNTANFNSATVLDFVASNTANLGNVGNLTILGGSNGQFLQTNGSGVVTWATVDASGISNGNSNVSIPISGGNVNISANGNPNVLVVTGSGAHVTGSLDVTSNITASNLTVNNELSGNFANFTSNVVVGNLTVNLELSGNTANFNTANVDDLAVSNTANLGNVGNLTILGGSNGQFLQTDGLGALTWATISSSGISNGTSNISIPTVNGDIEFSTSGIANVLVISSVSANFANNVNIVGNLVANNISANSNVDVTNLNANYIYANNTANIYGDLLANANLTVGLELSGNIGSFSTSLETPLIQNGNSNIEIVANGNIAISSAGSANVLVISNTDANLTGNLFVSGNLEVTGNFEVGSLVANSLTANNAVNIGNTKITWQTTTTTAITANQTIAQIPVASFIGVQFLVRGVDSSGAKYSVATVQAVTDGANIDYSVYGSVAIGGPTGILAVNIDSGNIALQVTPTSSNSTVWTTQYRLV